ncbi:MAG: hypothetical protein IJR28_07710, partial [Ottowia sp.]|nr:hypothetical protein [Ottowia sp.]
QAPVLQCPREDCRETLNGLEREGKGWLLVLDRKDERDMQPPEYLAGLREYHLPLLPPLLPAPGASSALHATVWLMWQPPSQ